MDLSTLGAAYCEDAVVFNGGLLIKHEAPSSAVLDERDRQSTRSAAALDCLNVKTNNLFSDGTAHTLIELLIRP